MLATAYSYSSIKRRITDTFVCQIFTRAVIAIPPYLSGNYCYVILFKPVRATASASYTDHELNF